MTYITTLYYTIVIIPLYYDFPNPSSIQTSTPTTPVPLVGMGAVMGIIITPS